MVMASSCDENILRWRCCQPNSRFCIKRFCVAPTWCGEIPKWVNSRQPMSPAILTGSVCEDVDPTTTSYYVIGCLESGYYYVSTSLPHPPILLTVLSLRKKLVGSRSCRVSMADRSRGLEDVGLNPCSGWSLLIQLGTYGGIRRPIRTSV